MSIRPSISRLAAVLALTGLLTGAGVAGSAAADAAPASSSATNSATHSASQAKVRKPGRAVTPATAAQSAGTWLAGQLTAGLMRDDRYGTNDLDLTAQTVLALKAVGGHDDVVAQSASALSAHAGEYLATPSGEQLAGPTASLLAVAEATGADVHSFGGVDLVARLESRVSTSSLAAGRLVDGLHYGDTVDTLDQALAVRDLASVGSAKVPALVAYLLQQQCTPGYFRLTLTDPHTPGQACQDGATTSAPDVAATAEAVLALRAAAPTASSADRSAIDGAVAKASSWLISAQGADGGFVANPASSKAAKAETTATAEAARALAALGKSAAAQQATAWLTRAQLTSGADAGAVAADQATKSATTGAVKPAARPGFRYATAAAVPGLLG